MVKNPPESAADSGDKGLIPGLGRSPGGGSSSPLKYSCLENPMAQEAWWASAHGVTESDMTEHTHIQELRTPFFILTSRGDFLVF